MSAMDEAVQAIRDFAEREREAQVALWSERDDDAVKEKVAALNDLYTGDLTANLFRSPGKSASWFRERKQEIEDTRTRPLFKVARYEHPKLGTLYRAYLGSNLAGDDGYFSSLYFGESGGKLRVVAQYNRCQECLGTGKVAERKCPECKGAGWSWRGGEKIDRPGTPAEVVRLREPSQPADRAEHNAD